MQPIKDKFILLFVPQSTPSGRRVTPLGLIAISSYLVQEGYDIRIFHAYDKNDYLEILDYLDKAICVGITSMTGYQICDGLRFARLVRQKNAKLPIIWGGIHPTIKPLQTIEHPLVDIVVKGPGEETFTELVHRLDRQESYDDVLGIVYKKDDKIIDNPPRPIKSINDYPSLPYYVLGDTVERYIKSNAYAKRILHYISSEGCPFSCAFCYLSTPIFTRKWDAYLSERVVDEIENLVKTYNLDGIDMRDSNFFIDPKRVIGICRGLLERNIKIHISGANGRAEQMIKYTPEDWELFKQVGIREILIGAESGDQEMLDLINKQSSVGAVLECERMARKYGINVINSFMTSFPPQTDNLNDIRKTLRRELNKTVDLLRQIFKINPIANTLLFFYTPYPATPLYDLAIKGGFKDPKMLEDWSLVDLTQKVTPWTSRRHVRKVLLLRQLLTLKKIISREYMKTKKGWKYIPFKYLGVLSVLNWWIDVRLKYKFYFFPFERIGIFLNRLIK